MEYHCVACNNTSNRNTEISFHKFPKNDNQRAIWIKYLNIPETIKNWDTVCDLHFPPNSYEFSNNRNTLKVNAVPIPRRGAVDNISSIKVEPGTNVNFTDISSDTISKAKVVQVTESTIEGSLKKKKKKALMAVYKELSDKSIYLMIENQIKNASFKNRDIIRDSNTTLTLRDIKKKIESERVSEINDLQVELFLFTLNAEMLNKPSKVINDFKHFLLHDIHLLTAEEDLHLLTDQNKRINKSSFKKANNDDCNHKKFDDTFSDIDSGEVPLVLSEIENSSDSDNSYSDGISQDLFSNI